MKISVEQYGTMPDGREVLVYSLENNSGMRVEILNYAGIIKNIFVPDAQGHTADVVLGHGSFEAYLNNDMYFGAMIGRNANRIAGGTVHVFGEQYELEKNAGDCNLHSGAGGLSRRLFSAEVRTFNNLPALLLSCTVEHLGDGFPGELTVTAAYALTNENALMIDYRAVSDRDTIINMTNHSYFNLAGHDSGTICDQTLEIDAGFYTPNTAGGYPDGEILRVEGTPFDFRQQHPIGDAIHSEHPQIAAAGGYDHNFVLANNVYRKVATACDPKSGRVMEVFTDLPGLQLYTANGLDGGSVYKDGARYQKHAGFCLETQLFPNAPNLPWFPSPYFLAGEEYNATTTYQFSVRESSADNA